MPALRRCIDCRITSTLPGYQQWFRHTWLREGNTPLRVMRQAGAHRPTMSLSWFLPSGHARIIKGRP
ncbi:hypothetical protein GEV01_11325 [Rugamonas sp. FT103W]|uniref:Uncharacterized protein n=1 Tax=Rugamonas rivuli TaxID=2743358 RepID=A0A843S7B5_9BURK|nr:hypothetical protein [Rugamonas rivuli]